MQDQGAAEQASRAEGTTETFDLVVVGAGVAGLNALYAATDYLPKGARVLLIDQKQGPGGMWNTAYDFVRLHQPHPMFTVGDVKWDWTKPRDYLAKRDEVRAHLTSALGPVSDSVELETAFEQTVVEAEEVQTDYGYKAKVVFRPNAADSPTRTVLANVAIHAQG
ncbi:MAG: NAD(P)-binding protein [Rhizobiaceae bacterium]|nr:NAD(P)-binding protein [Rhizobiaceae bacterium]